MHMYERACPRACIPRPSPNGPGTIRSRTRCRSSVTSLRAPSTSRCRRPSKTASASPPRGPARPLCVPNPLLSRCFGSVCFLLWRHNLLDPWRHVPPAHRPEPGLVVVGHGAAAPPRPRRRRARGPAEAWRSSPACPPRRPVRRPVGCPRAPGACAWALLVVLFCHGFSTDAHARRPARPSPAAPPFQAAREQREHREHRSLLFSGFVTFVSSAFFGLFCVSVCECDFLMNVHAPAWQLK